MRAYKGHEVYVLEEGTEWKRFGLFHELTFFSDIEIIHG